LAPYKRHDFKFWPADNCPLHKNAVKILKFETGQVSLKLQSMVAGFTICVFSIFHKKFFVFLLQKRLLLFHRYFYAVISNCSVQKYDLSLAIIVCSKGTHQTVSNSYLQETFYNNKLCTSVQHIISEHVFAIGKHNQVLHHGANNVIFHARTTSKVVGEDDNGEPSLL